MLFYKRRFVMRNANIEKFEDYVFYDAQAGERFEALSREGMTSAFLYSQNVFQNGEIKKYDSENRRVRTVAVGGRLFVPSALFSAFLGAGVTLSGTSYTISYDGRAYSFSLGDDGAFAEGKTVYVNAEKSLTALGFTYGIYYEGRLLCIGSRENIKKMDGDADMQQAGAYIVLGKYDTSIFTPEDYKQARDNWRKKLVGSPEINDMSDPVIREKVESIGKRCKEKWDSLNKNPDRRILWGDHIPTESNELWIQYQGICDMAKGWGTYGCEYYHNEKLHTDIVEAMRWMYENMYGEAEIAGTGWRDAHLFNWWYWYIAAPEFITDIFFIMEDSFTMEEKRAYLKCFEWVYTFMRRGIKREMALSRICICTKVAIALCDPKRLYEEYVDYDLLLGLGELEEGPRIDYTQWTHGFPMNLGYGRLNLDRVLYAASALAGTALEYPSPKQYNQFEVVKYMFEPGIYKTRGMTMLRGRATAGREISSGAAAIAYMLIMIGIYGKDEDEYIKHMVKRNAVTSETLAYIKNAGSILDCTILDSIMRDTEVSAENDYEYAHAWFTGDRAVQHRNNYAFGIAMSSNREFTYECINGENKTGWHTGDGATYLYTDYDDSSFDGDNSLSKNINIAYRFPGTTEDSRERAIVSIRSTCPWHPSKHFAGSINFEDKYLTAAMDFEAFHFEGPVQGDPDDSGYGGPLPVHFNDLVGKKAWFCFDDEIVALGAGINSSMDSEVRTTLDHRRIVRDSERSIFYKIKGEDAVECEREPYEKSLCDAEWVLVEGHAGYVFLDKTLAHLGRYDCAEAGGQSFFEIRCEHGKNPKDSSYAYAILPYADKIRAEKYASSPEVELLSNTSKLQTVREKNLRLSSYVFYEAGKCGAVESDSGIIVMIKERNGALDFALTDPTHLLKRARITLDGVYEAVEKNPKLTVSVSDGKTVIDADLELANGRPFRAVLKG